MLCSPLLLCFWEAFIADTRITSTALPPAPAGRAAGYVRDDEAALAVGGWGRAC